MIDHVPITIVAGAPGVAPVRLDLPWGPLDDLLWGARPGRVVARDAAYGGKGRLRKRVKSVVALDAGPSLIVRRSLVDRALAGVPAAELRRIPVALVDDEGVIDDDFVLLDPTAWVPMDREACDADHADPSNPHGAECTGVRRLAWGEGPAPAEAAFRLGEHPEVVIVRRDLAEALSKALKRAIVVVDPPYPGDDGAFSIASRPKALPFRPILGAPGRARPWQPAAEAARSAEAFWALRGGRGDAAARAIACESAHYAFWLARAVDAAPADDTRRGAIADAGYAFAYAALVDRAPRDDTRAAAAATPDAAIAYAKYVDRGAHEVTRSAVAGTPWEPDYPTLCADGARVAAAVAEGAWGAPAPVAAPPPAASPAPLARPAPEGGRYAEDSGPADPPTHAPLDAGVRSDVDAFVGHGLELVGLDAADGPEAVIAAIHAFVGQVQQKTRKLAKRKHAEMALGCAFGEQLHRVLGWQWASVRAVDGGGVAMVSPDRGIAIYPFAMMERLLAPRERSNTVELTFAMVASGVPPPGAKAGAYTALV